MKVRILKSFFLDGIQYIKGEIVEISPNLAHGLYEARLTLPYVEKGVDEPKNNKMMSRRRKRVSTK